MIGHPAQAEVQVCGPYCPRQRQLSAQFAVLLAPLSQHCTRDVDGFPQLGTAGLFLLKLTECEVDVMSWVGTGQTDPGSRFGTCPENRPSLCLIS